MNNRHKLCQFPGCTAHATFKHIGDVHATYCGQHREESMVQVRVFSDLSQCLSRSLHFVLAFLVWCLCPLMRSCGLIGLHT